MRVWKCPNCLTTHDRDTNASINILNKGLAIV
ncbi:MAG: zinc ribbon domain-containing protein [Eubacteriales bacterium]|nr:zinc ribbon domain-containing protein [Eubacteriales bacterium]MDD4683564.1 zinc ribbon domain-containing protein [Eubacteriales bacterium]